MELNELYLELLKYPNSPKVYRELQKYYKNKEIFDAFSYLLKVRFNEIPELYASNSVDDNKKQ